MNREPGYYWVEVLFGNMSDWIICKYTNNQWSINTYYTEYLQDSKILNVDEHKIEQHE